MIYTLYHTHIIYACIFTHTYIYVYTDAHNLAFHKIFRLPAGAPNNIVRFSFTAPGDDVSL